MSDVCWQAWATSGESIDSYGRYVSYPAGNTCFQPTGRGVHLGGCGMSGMSGRIHGGWWGMFPMRSQVMRPPSRGFCLMPLWRRNLLCGTLGRSDKHACMSFMNKVFLQNFS